MLDSEFLYLFADPFGRNDSGVSSYIAYARNVLSANNIQTVVISRNPNESLPVYRKRLAKNVADIRKSKLHIVVEAPETDAVTLDIPSDTVDIHIRLHCSRQLGVFVQGGQVCSDSLELEQREINRATIISAPSHSAVIASRVIFNLPENVLCFPNPAPFCKNISSTAYVNKPAVALFMGRFHSLKGVHWVIELAKRIPEVSFLMVGPILDQRFAKKSLSNVYVIDGASCARSDIYEQVTFVVIPSIYETASMVGIEALAAGVPVVAWRHLGIAEYAHDSMLTLVEPYKIDLFVEAVRKRAQPVQQDLDERTISKTINDSYLRGYRAVLSGSVGNFMPILLSKERRDEVFLCVSNSVRMTNMQTQNSMPSWSRKLRKLRSDPILFLNDWWIKRFGAPPTQRVVIEKSRLEKSQGPQIFAGITKENRIEFQEPPQKPEGFISAFFYPVDRKSEADLILAGLRIFEDFRYGQSPLLQIGTFQELDDVSSTELLDRIDKKNKERISKVDHIILLDPFFHLTTALRCSGTRQRTIVILDSKDTPTPDPWYTDVLIIIGENHPVASTKGWRRKIIVRERSHLPAAIRRAIQEGVPKTPDMLLPLLGFNDPQRNKMMEFDVNFYQGVIRSKPFEIHKGMTMASITGELARAMTELAITESIYLRYRSLCDQIENEENRALFLSFSLFDGVLFDVQV